MIWDFLSDRRTVDPAIAPRISPACWRSVVYNRYNTSTDLSQSPVPAHGQDKIYVSGWPCTKSLFRRGIGARDVTCSLSKCFVEKETNTDNLSDPLWYLGMPTCIIALLKIARALALTLTYLGYLFLKRSRPVCFWVFLGVLFYRLLRQGPLKVAWVALWWHHPCAAIRRVG